MLREGRNVNMLALWACHHTDAGVKPLRAASMAANMAVDSLSSLITEDIKPISQPNISFPCEQKSV